MLSDSIAVLSSAPPPSPIAARREALGNANAEISRLEAQLDIAHGMPILNPTRAVKRLTELQAQVAAKNLTPATAAAPVAATTSPAVDDPPSDTVTLKATLPEFYSMDAVTRTQFAADGGALSKSDFDRLTLASKSAFCVSGGRILDDSPVTSRTLSTAAVSFGGK